MFAKDLRADIDTREAHGKESSKNLKRAGDLWRKEAWNGPSLSQPYQFTGGLAGPGDGSGTHPPPKPPDLKTVGEESSGNPSNHSAFSPGDLGVFAEGDGGPASTRSASAAIDVSMEEAAAGDREVEVVPITQF